MNYCSILIIFFNGTFIYTFFVCMKFLINLQVQLPPTTSVNNAPTVPNSCLINGARFGSEESCRAVFEKLATTNIRFPFEEAKTKLDDPPFNEVCTYIRVFSSIFYLLCNVYHVGCTALDSLFLVNDLFVF